MFSLFIWQKQKERRKAPGTMLHRLKTKSVQN
uniref:Uncharacterized protein n=1 Tax=Anguilla anguilla TaxID=7936 RepID=A0A0E9VIC6_ANGAN